MGYTQHRFLIVHSWDLETINTARALAEEVFPPRLLGPVMLSVINGESGFVVWTSGSKVGWPEDTDHQENLAEFISKLSRLPKPPRWVRVDSGEEVGDITAEHGYDGDYTHIYETASVAREPGDE
jgi:hypothetical protein